MRAVPPAGRGVQAGMSRMAFSEQPMPDWWLPGLAANFARAETQLAWREEGRQMVASAFPDPSGLALPVLVIHGDDDRLVPVAVGHELQRRASDGRIVVVEGGSHMLPITHAQRMADEIAGFAAPR
jgi:non-heme chloroperoxidase